MRLADIMDEIAGVADTGLLLHDGRRFLQALEGDAGLGGDLLVLGGGDRQGLAGQAADQLVRRALGAAGVGGVPAGRLLMCNSHLRDCAAKRATPDGSVKHY